MKNLLLGIFCICTCALHSQTSDKAFYKHEIGLNVTELLNTVFNSNTTNDNSIYTLIYRRRINEKKAIRTGFGIQIVQNSNDTDGGNGFRVLSSTNLNARVGFEWRTNISNKLDFFYGIDLLGGYANSESTFFNFNGRIENISSITSIGGGPLLGIQFHINDRMSISTETTLYYVFSRNKQRTSENGSQFIDLTSKNSIFQHTLPSSLFFHVRL